MSLKLRKVKFNMNILFTICARAGSKGVANKNIRMFRGIPLVYYTLAAYELFINRYGQMYDKILLAINTDSEQLIHQVKATNVEFTHIEREAFLAGDTVSKTDVIKDTVFKMQEQYNNYYDIIIDLDLTSPLRTEEDIYGTINELLAYEWADVAFSVTNARRSPYFNMVRKKSDESYDSAIQSEYISRQQAPQCFDMNASIYAYRNSFITSDKTTRVFDGKAVCHNMMDTAVLDIDNEEDFELMELIASYIYSKYPNYSRINLLARRFIEV